MCNVNTAESVGQCKVVIGCNGSTQLMEICTHPEKNSVHNPECKMATTILIESDPADGASVAI